QNGDVRRSLPITIEAGSSVSQYVELTSAEPIPASREKKTGPPPAPLLATVPPPVTGPRPGGLSAHVPLATQSLDSGRIRGITSADRLMLPSGRHEIELVSKAFEFRATRAIQINPGKVAEVTASVPNGLVSINALPWADVSIEGRPVGATPISNLS